MIFLATSALCSAQVIYNPQLLYDAPGGLFDQTILRTLDVTFYNPSYDTILDSAWTNNTGVRLPATLQLDGGQYYPNVMVRYKGNSTFDIPNGSDNPKLPYNFDMNDSVPGQTLMGYNKVKLANAILDPTFVKEISAFNIYRRYLPTPEANFMKLNVQGSYLGMYINTESVDRKFLNKHFGNNNGALFKCDPVQQFGQSGGPTGSSDLTWLGSDTTLYYNHYSMKSNSGWSDLVNLINVLNNSPSDLDTVLNIDRVLWAFAVNQAILNLDTYNGLFQHNYYLYKSDDGLFQMIPWDASESFLGALLTANLNSTALYEYNPFNGYNSWWYPLSLVLTSNPNSQYGKIYTAHLRTIIDESLDATAIENSVNTLQSLALPAVTADPNKLFGMAQFYSNVTSEFVIPFVFKTAGIISSVDLRKPYLQSLPALQNVPPSIAAPVVLPPSGAGENYVTAQVGNATSVELMATLSQYNSKFISIPMFDDGTNGDQTSGDGNYTGAFPWYFGGNEAKFYIRANNASAIMLNPERAEYEFYTYNLPVGINDLESSLEINLYPNPATDFVQISNPSGALLNYSITNSFGSIVTQEVLNSPTIDVSEYSSGLYFVYFQDEHGRRLIKKMIVQ